MKKVLIAGGLCGTTMLTAADKIKERCRTRNQEIHVKIQNLWETSYVTPDMISSLRCFPVFEEEKCPVIAANRLSAISGKGL